MSFYLKDPGASLDYTIDWSPFTDGETIESSEWTVAPAEAGGIEVAADGADALRTIARIGGGLPGRCYRVTNRIILSDGSIDERSITLRVEER